MAAPQVARCGEEILVEPLCGGRHGQPVEDQQRRQGAEARCQTDHEEEEERTGDAQDHMPGAEFVLAT